MKNSILLAFSVAMLSACASDGIDPAGQASSPATPSAAPDYVAMAGSSDLYEIESSRLALARATTPGVKQFAQMMIDHHMMTTQQVTAAARSAGMSPPPPTLLPPQRAMLDALQPVQGQNFEREYLDQQRNAHRMALELHQNYARNGDVAQLREAASKAVPVVQRHIQQLQTMPGG